MAVEWIIDRLSTTQMRAKRIEEKRKQEERRALSRRYLGIAMEFSNWLIESRDVYSDKGGSYSRSRGEGVMEKDGKFYDVDFHIDSNPFSVEYSNELRVYSQEKNKVNVWQYRYAENSQLPSYLLYESRVYDSKSDEWVRVEWGEYFDGENWTFASDNKDKPTVDVIEKFEELTRNWSPFRETRPRWPDKLQYRKESFPRRIAQ